MTSADAPKKARPDPNGREARLKAALKANMGRRKAQARERAEGDAAEAGQDDNRQDEG